MSYIAPNTEIILIKDCPLDNTYDHTIFFTSKAAQYEYFSSLKKRTFVEQTYQRIKKGTLRVQVLSDDIYDCNYLMFKNKSFGNKNFYAFITNIEYINNVTSEITYEIDVMQTWHFDYEMGKCYVEREHIADDTFANNLAPEPVSIGEYVISSYKEYEFMKELYIVAAVVDTDASPDSNIYDGVFGGATLYAATQTNRAAVNDLISRYIQKPESIISIYLVPTFCFDSATQLLVETASDQMVKITKTIRSNYIGEGDSKLQLTEDLDGYVPQNKKMYTYPYNFYVLYNNQGQSLNIRYEFCSDRTPKFRFRSCITQPVSTVANPIDYKNVDINYAESLAITNYPICSWAVDVYDAWVAQNSVPIAMNLIAGAWTPVITGGINALAGNAGAGISGGLSNTINNVINLMQVNYKASIAADVIKGSTQVGNINVSSDVMTFFGYRYTLNNHDAKRIDEFLTRYGYAKGRLKYPNRNVRPHWTYIKTAGAVITGSVPADDMNKICNIYDHGITFWKNGNEIGNYDLDNRV